MVLRLVCRYLFLLEGSDWLSMIVVSSLSLSMFMYLRKFHHDLTWRPKPIDDGEYKGNYPLLWPNYSG